MLLVAELPSRGHHSACPELLEESTFPPFTSGSASKSFNRCNCFQIFRNFAHFSGCTDTETFLKYIVECLLNKSAFNFGTVIVELNIFDEHKLYKTCITNRVGKVTVAYYYINCNKKEPLVLLHLTEIRKVDSINLETYRNIDKLQRYF